MNNLVLFSPQSLAETCEMLAETRGKLIAGGTDVIPQMRDGRFPVDTLIDLGHVRCLDDIQQLGGHTSMGAMTTYTAMRRSSLLRTAAPLLVEAAGLVGGVQVQNRGTIGGNIVNASPAGDTLPPLLALNAEVTLINSDGERTLPVSDFLMGPGSTRIGPDEVVRAVRFQPLAAGTRSTFMRLGNRRGMVISNVSAAVVLTLDMDNRVEDVRIALGAVAPTAIRCREAESLLIGQVLTEELIELASAAAVEGSSPIDDVRGTASYRLHGIRVLVRRSLETMGGLREPGGCS